MTKNLKAWLATRSHRYSAIGVLLLIVFIVIGILGYHASHRAVAAITTRRGSSTQVSVATAGSLSSANAPLSIIGEVTSLAQATILAQMAGEITNLEKSIGDHVSAGETIATLEDSSQEAAVLQAQGAYDAANAALVKTGGGGSAVDTQASQAAVLESAYTTLDDAVHTKADTLFEYPRSANPTLLPPFDAIQYYSIDGQELVPKVEDERQALESILARDYTLASDATSSDLTANISEMATDAQTVGAFLSDLAEAVDQVEIQNEAGGSAILPTATVSGYETTVTAARSEVATAVTDLTGALNTYDTSGAQADVEEAEGSLESAQATLAKTVITSPVSGIIVDLPITEGDYVSSGAEVAEVSDPGALKIVAHVSAADASTLSVGNAATVNGSDSGTISQISPAIDPETGTIEVDVALTGPEAGLVDGDSVTVDLDRTPSALASSTVQITIPIVALKITPTGPEVFTIDPTKSVLVAHPVEIGSILGQNIVIIQGLASDDVIVIDARGLVAGEDVTVKKS